MDGSHWKTIRLSVHNDEDGFNLLSILEAQLGCALYAAHRLDQPTSGVMLLAKDPSNAQMLQQALSTATKEYTAILMRSNSSGRRHMDMDHQQQR